LEGGPPSFSPRFTGADLLRNACREVTGFRLRDDCPLWCAVPRASATPQLCNSRRAGHGSEADVLQPPTGNACPLTPAGFGLVPFRSPLLGESRLISFPRGTEMFHFPRLASTGLWIQPGIAPHYQRWVSPFGNPRVTGYSAPHRGLSQPITPFIASWCLGIHRVPLLS
jgi:hypothetical protein